MAALPLMPPTRFSIQSLLGDAFEHHCFLYYMGRRKTMPLGWDFGVDLPTAVARDQKAYDYVVNLGLTPAHEPWKPANEAGERRWKKAYTDRGLKVA